MPVRITRGNPIENAWIMYQSTYESVMKCADETSARTGLSHRQYQVLRAIKDISGMVTATAVANWLDRNPNSITLIIDRMEKAGMVKRVRDLGDRRSIRLMITPEGERRREMANKPAYELSKEILSALTEDELSTFVELLSKIREKTFELRNIQDNVTDVSLID